MALRRTADEVDEQLEEWMRESGREQVSLDQRVLVYVDATPFARTLVRRGWRLAQGMHGDLLVTYLKRPFNDAEQTELARTVELAEDLNARVLPIDAQDEPQGLRALVAAEDVRHIVLAHRPRSGLGALKPSLADRLAALSPNVDIHLVSRG
jgi:two-component system sensor histidine kinase KdpD